MNPGDAACCAWRTTPTQPPWLANVNALETTRGFIALRSPRNDAVLPANETLMPELLSAVLARSSPPALQQSAWHDAAARSLGARLPLRVAVLGTSVTAGCGSTEPWVWNPGEKKSATKYLRCELPRSWGRRMHDELNALLQRAAGHTNDANAADAGHACAAETSVAFKNAVGVQYFSHCVGRHLPPAGAHLVLLESTLEMSWGSKHSAPNMRALLRKLRATLSHRVPIVLVGWTSQGSGPKHTMPPHVLTIAEEEGVEVVPVAPLMGMLHQDGLLAMRQNRTNSLNHPLPSQTSFALRGQDPVHPSPVGHLLMASTVARFIGERLLSAHCSGGGLSSTRHSRKDSALERSAATTSAAKAATTSAAAMEPSMVNLLSWEECFDTLQSDERPVNRTNSRGKWPQIDEGGAKGVAKKGLVSYTTGELLALGPLSLPPSLTAAPTLVEVRHIPPARFLLGGGTM